MPADYLDSVEFQTDGGVLEENSKICLSVFCIICSRAGDNINK